MNPLSRLLEDRLPAIDAGVMSHGFAAHGRDYVFVLENAFGPEPGTYRLTFTHVVELNHTTSVTDDVWQRSWSDPFTDYKAWEDAGEPDGYVFGTNWSLAYPGFEAVNDDPVASTWSARLDRSMYKATIGTDRFEIGLVFHDVRLEQVNDHAPTVSQVFVPLPPAVSS
ncbi:hypothetical protein ABC347_16815 [Sphingomonas sp. 1P06PA]|uniref:YxiG-like protein n=1 Tax=Sphingomonas sp. 1P06PA TaxID=554121 RepID=UPI0039A6FD42